LPAIAVCQSPEMAQTDRVRGQARSYNAGGTKPLGTAPIGTAAPCAFPAKAGPTVRTWCFSGTGFSREQAIGYTLDSAVWHLPLSRL